MANKILLEIEFQGSSAINKTAELRKQLEELQKTQKGLDKTTDDGRIAYEQYAAEIKETSRELRSVTKFIDDSTRSIKAQEGSIEGNRAKLSQLTAEYVKASKPTQKQTNDIKDLSDKLKEQEGALGDTRRNVGNYKEALLSGANGVKVFGQGLGDLFKAILTNPIGILITAVVALFQAFKRIEPVFDFIEAGFAAIKAAVDAVIGSFGKLLTGDFIGFFNGITTGVANAAKETFALARAVQDLEDAQRAFNVEAAKNEASVKNLIIQSKDRTKSEKERLALLDEASKKEEDNFNKALKLAQEEKRIADQELAIAERSNTANDELRDKAAQAEIKLIQLQSSSADLQEKITNRKNVLIESEIEIRQKSADKQRELLEKLSEEERKRLQESRDFLLKTENELSDIRKKTTEEDVKIKTKAAIKLQELEQVKEDFFKSTIKDKFRAQLQQNEDERFNLIDKLTQEKDLRIAAGEDALRVEREFQENKEAVNKEFGERADSLEKQRQDFLAKTQEEKYATIIGATHQALGDLSTIFADNFEAQKSIAIADTLISTYEAAQKSYMSLAGIPIIGPALGGVAAGLSIAAGLARVDQIRQQKPKLAEGGAIHVGGKPHSQGGTQYVGEDGNAFEVESGENIYVLKKTASQYINGLSGLNQSFGGKSFGTSNNYLASGGSVAVGNGGFNERSSSQSINDKLDLRAAMKEAMSEIPSPILKVSDLNRVQEGVNNAVNVSDL